MSYTPLRWTALVALTLFCNGTATGDVETERGTLQVAENERASYRNIEEMVVTGEFDGADLNVAEREMIYGRKQLAARAFKLGKYGEAFPELLALAKMGFKDAQARVGFIYLHGLGGIQKSNIKALGWLGVATTNPTRPQYRNYFKQLLREVPEAQQRLIADTVAEYREKYDSKTQGVECDHSGIHAGLMFTCRFADEIWAYARENPCSVPLAPQGLC